jgi:hypothetical protein
MARIILFFLLITLVHSFPSHGQEEQYLMVVKVMPREELAVQIGRYNKILKIRIVCGKYSDCQMNAIAISGAMNGSFYEVHGFAIKQIKQGEVYEPLPITSFNIRKDGEGFVWLEKTILVPMGTTSDLDIAAAILPFDETPVVYGPSYPAYAEGETKIQFRLAGIDHSPIPVGAPAVRVEFGVGNIIKVR